MARKVFTLRIDAEERSALENLSKIERRPINQLLNEAIKIYLNRKGSAEHRMEASLTALRAYRKRDPGFHAAIDAFVEAEANLPDPIEGTPIEGPGSDKPAGPVQRKVRDVLGA